MIDDELYHALGEMHKKNQPFAIVTVVEVIGSTSAKTGSKALIDQDGYVVTGWVGGGCAESTACGAAVSAMQTGETDIIEIDLDDEVLGAGMPCGGHMRLYIEPTIPKPVVWILGHGAVAENLCALAAQMGFLVTVNDPMAIEEKFPNAHRRITDDLDYLALTPAANDYVIIATQHKGDHDSMTRALASESNYIALIASRKRSRLVLDFLRKNEVSEENLKRVMAPCGIDLGARTPAEIALSVISEIVMTRREGSGARMRDTLELEQPSPSGFESDFKSKLTTLESGRG